MKYHGDDNGEGELLIAMGFLVLLLALAVVVLGI